MNAFAPALKRPLPTAGTGLLQRKCAACGSHKPAAASCAACDKEDRRLQRRSNSSGSEGLRDGGQAPPIVHEVLRSPGQPLGESARAFFEPRFGHDFSAVRVHTDAKAAASARAVEAEAYTVGNRIVFGAGRSSSARHDGLLAHELAHVAQAAQRLGAVSEDIEVSPSNGAAEGDADAAARAAMSGRLVQLRERPRPALFRQSPAGVSPWMGPGSQKSNPLAPFADRVTTVPPPPGPYLPRCGPDVTAWFVRTVNGATNHPVVGAIKIQMAKAAEAAKPLGLTTEQLGEAGATVAV